MAWNQPGNDGQDRDPWGSGNKGGNSGGNKGGRKRGASDLDDLFRKLSNKLGGKKAAAVVVMVIINSHSKSAVALVYWLSRQSSLYGRVQVFIPSRKVTEV